MRVPRHDYGIDLSRLWTDWFGMVGATRKLHMSPLLSRSARRSASGASTGRPNSRSAAPRRRPSRRTNSDIALSRGRHLYDGHATGALACCTGAKESADGNGGGARPLRTRTALVTRCLGARRLDAPARPRNDALRRVCRLRRPRRGGHSGGRRRQAFCGRRRREGNGAFRYTKGRPCECAPGSHDQMPSNKTLGRFFRSLLG